MKGFIGLTKRNLLIYFKDKQSVVFSLLTSIILLILYLLFLKGTFVDAMNGVINTNEGLGSLVRKEDIEMFAKLILLSGILGSAMITIPFNCLNTVVKDRENKVDYDILATPIRRGQIILSYFVSAALSSIILNIIILSVGLLAIGSQGNLYMGISNIAALFGVVALGSISATALFMIVVLCFKSSGACGAFFGILSAACGFIIGAYIPISQFSKSVQTFCNIFPASQVTIMLRNLLMNGILEHMNDNIGGVDNGMFVDAIKDIFTFKANLFDSKLDMKQMMIYILTSIVVFVVTQIVVYSNTYKKKS